MTTLTPEQIVFLRKVHERGASVGSLPCPQPPTFENPAEPFTENDARVYFSLLSFVTVTYEDWDGSREGVTDFFTAWNSKWLWRPSECRIALTSLAREMIGVSE